MQRRSEAIESGKYRRDTDRALREFAGWLAQERDVTELEAIDTLDCRRYAQHLRQRVRDTDDPLDSFASANQYFAYVRAWLSWCVDDERLEANPAEPNRASDPLPDPGEQSDTQFWNERQRKAICSTANAYVEAALDGEIDTDLAYRDRALVFTLAYSGCRGAELLRHPDDEDREGISWGDVDLERGILSVFGKDRDWETAPLFSPAVEPLRRWRERSEADADGDAVFPRLDNAAKGMETRPTISTQAGRDALHDLCEWSDYEFDEPLNPHGARRGLGHAIYRKSAETAQEVLRHDDLQTTHEGYQDQQTVDVRERGEAILFDENAE